MLELKDLTVRTGKPGKERTALREISARLPLGHLCALIGPPGAGCREVLETLAGQRAPALGGVCWPGLRVEQDLPLQPWDVGFAPAGNVFPERATPAEWVGDSIRLRAGGPGGVGGRERAERTAAIIEKMGLAEVANRQLRGLAPDLQRRAALAAELATSPRVLLADHLVDGLVPKAEGELLRLLKDLAREGRVAVVAPGTLHHLALYDSVMVLIEGHLAFHGPTEYLCHYFRIERPDDLFARLAEREAADWHRSWIKHRGPYYAQQQDTPTQSAPATEVRSAEEEPSATLSYEKLKEIFDRTKKEAEEGGGPLASPPAPIPLPPPGQATMIFARRIKAFCRTPADRIWFLLILLLGPALVAFAAWEAMPVLRDPPTAIDQAARAGGLAAGLILLQVVILGLAGAFNGAREIAAERPVLEKEKNCGLQTGPYLAGKAAFVGLLAALQGFWFAAFSHHVGRCPGDYPALVAVFVMTALAWSMIALAVSAHAPCRGAAAMIAPAIVLLQLPLAGVILAPPDAALKVLQPAMTLYQGWAGALATLRETALGTSLAHVLDTSRTTLAWALGLLAGHAILAAFIAHGGCRRSTDD